MDQRAPALADDVRMLRDSAKALCAQFGGSKRHRAIASGEGFDRTRWHAIVEAGWLAAPLSEDQGGLDQGLAGLAVLLKEAGRALVTEPVGATVAVTLSAAWIAPRHPLVTGAFSRGAVLVPALPERTAGIDLDRVETQAHVAGGRMQLHGTKVAVAHAPHAAGFLVNAMGEGGPVVCYVPADAPGLEMRPRRNLDGTMAADLVLDAVAVPIDHVTASGRDAERQTRSMLAISALAAAAELAGLSDRANEIGLDYLQSRRQFGRPIGSFQALQHAAAINHVDAQMSAALTLSCARSLDLDLAGAAAAFAAKAYASDVALSVTKSLIQFHGGMGFTESCDAHLYLKRAMVLSADLGNSSAMRRLFGNLRNRAEAA